MTRLRTAAGREYDLLKPNFGELSIEEIALGLSRVPRFVGQTLGEPAYSVAQHSVVVSTLCPEHPLAALLHDAAEMFTGDIPSPVKALLGRKLARLEKIIERAICRRFGLEVDPWPAAVKEADAKAYDWEHRDLRGPTNGLAPGLGACFLPARRLVPVEARLAAANFQARYQELLEK